MSEPIRTTYAGSFVSSECNYRANEDGIYGKVGQAITKLKDADNTIARLESESQSLVARNAELTEAPKYIVRTFHLSDQCRDYIAGVLAEEQ